MTETRARRLANWRAALDRNPQVFVNFKLVKVWTRISSAPTEKVDWVIMSQKNMRIPGAGDQHTWQID